MEEEAEGGDEQEGDEGGMADSPVASPPGPGAGRDDGEGAADGKEMGSGADMDLNDDEQVGTGGYAPDPTPSTQGEVDAQGLEGQQEAELKAAVAPRPELLFDLASEAEVSDDAEYTPN